MKCVPCFSSIFFLLVAAIQPAVGQIEGLRTRIPDDTNTVVIINAEKMFGSPAADRERWEAKRNAAFEAGLTFLSPETTGVVLAAKIDAEYGETVWELAQLRLREQGSINDIATRYGAETDMIEGRAAARLRNDSIIVQLNPQNFASFTPANRQEVARWLRQTDTTANQSRLTPYLQQAFRYVEEGGTPVIMAIDLAHVFSKKQIATKLQDSEVAEAAGDKLNEIVDTLAGLKGAMIGVTVGEKPYGSIRVDFSGSAAPLAEVGKTMLINVLKNQGAMIDDIEQWEASAEETTFLMRGSLSAAGLRRILSVLELPASLGKSLDDTKMELAENPESLKRIATQQYFKSVTGLLDDLQQQRKRNKMFTPGSVAMWYDKYAKKIDSLPILNVDDEMLMYGKDVSGLLRGGETALKSVGMRTSLRQGVNEPVSGYDGYNSYYAYDGGYNGYGGYRAGYVDPYYSVREKGRTDAIISSQERTRGAAQAQSMWQQIETQSADIRRAMTKKYNVEF